MNEAKRLMTPEERLAAEQREADIRNTEWESASTDIKLEKLRMAILELPNYGYQINDVQRKVRLLERHSHTENGEIVIPMDMMRNGDSAIGADSSLRRRNPLE